MHIAINCFCIGNVISRTVYQEPDSAIYLYLTFIFFLLSYSYFDEITPFSLLPHQNKNTTSHFCITRYNPLLPQGPGAWPSPSPGQHHFNAAAVHILLLVYTAHRLLSKHYYLYTTDNVPDPGTLTATVLVTGSTLAAGINCHLPVALS